MVHIYYRINTTTILTKEMKSCRKYTRDDLHERGPSATSCFEIITTMHERKIAKKNPQICVYEFCMYLNYGCNARRRDIIQRSCGIQNHREAIVCENPKGGHFGNFGK